MKKCNCIFEYPSLSVALEKKKKKTTNRGNTENNSLSDKFNYTNLVLVFLSAPLSISGIRQGAGSSNEFPLTARVTHNRGDVCRANSLGERLFFYIDCHLFRKICLMFRREKILHMGCFWQITYAMNQTRRI